jgi:LysR family glycine cleavage system transcriptional activator
VADDLARGRLARPFDASLSTPLSFCYYLLSPNDDQGHPKIKAFRDWLLDEVHAVPADVHEKP